MIYWGLNYFFIKWKGPNIFHFEDAFSNRGQVKLPLGIALSTRPRPKAQTGQEPLAWLRKSKRTNFLLWWCWWWWVSLSPDWQTSQLSMAVQAFPVTCRRSQYLLPLSYSTFEEWWVRVSCLSGHGSGIRRRILLCLLRKGLLGPLKWQRHSSRGRGLPSALCLATCPPARLPACTPRFPSTPQLNGHWSLPAATLCPKEG